MAYAHRSGAGQGPQATRRRPAPSKIARVREFLVSPAGFVFVSALALSGLYHSVQQPVDDAGAATPDDDAPRMIFKKEAGDGQHAQEADYDGVIVEGDAQRTPQSPDEERAARPDESGVEGNVERGADTSAETTTPGATENVARDAGRRDDGGPDADGRDGTGRDGNGRDTGTALQETFDSASSDPAVTPPEQFHGAPADIARQLQSASRKTGLSFGTLMAIANAESLNWDANSSNPASSAQGLLQMTRGYFLQHVYEAQDFLAQQGYADIADMVRSDGPVLKEGTDPQAFYAHRDDPYLSALIVGHTLMQEAEDIQEMKGEPPTTADMYALHFLGKRNGMAFLEYYYNYPEYRHHNILDMPFISEGAVARNENVFFAHVAPDIRHNNQRSCLAEFNQGNRAQCRPRSVGEIYDYFQGKTGTQVAVANPSEFQLASDRPSDRPSDRRSP